MGKLRLTEVKTLANVGRSLKYRSFDLAPGGLRGGTVHRGSGVEADRLWRYC